MNEKNRSLKKIDQENKKLQTKQKLTNKMRKNQHSNKKITNAISF